MTNEIEEKIREYERQIKQIPDSVARRDLTTMLNAARGTISELSREAVNCRRHQRPSLRYSELVEQYETQIETLEGYLLQAVFAYR